MTISKTTFFILACLMVAFGIFLLIGRPETSSEDPDPLSAVEPRAEDSPSDDDVSRARAWPSIDVLMEREPDGGALALGTVQERNPAYTRYFMTYRSGELSISGIMNVPTGDGPFPVLILNHGYIDPAVYTNGRGLRREQDYLARQGFVVIHPDYRNHAQSDRVDDGELENRLGYAEDVINLVAAVRASDLPFLDPDRIGMLGHSMGGGIAQTIAVAKPDLVSAIVLYAPVSMDYRDSYERYMRGSGRAERIASRYGSPSDNPSFWDGMSPAVYADRISVPILLFQGTEDESVSKEWSDRTAVLLESKGKTFEYVVYPGEGHEFGPEWEDFISRSARFFRDRLDG